MNFFKALHLHLYGFVDKSLYKFWKIVLKLLSVSFVLSYYTWPHEISSRYLICRQESLRLLFECTSNAVNFYSFDDDGYHPSQPIKCIIVNLIITLKILNILIFLNIVNNTNWSGHLKNSNLICFSCEKLDNLFITFFCYSTIKFVVEISRKLF